MSPHRSPYDDEPTVLAPPEERTLEARAPSDPTLEAPPEDPTVSAQVDVRAAFAAHDVALPKASAVLVESDEHPAHRQEHTLPLVPPRAPPPAPESGRDVESGRAPESGRDVASDETPYEVPGIGPPRRGMKGIVIGVLAFCGLLCIGAAAVSLWPHAKSAEGGSVSANAGSSSTSTTASTSTTTSTSEAAEVPMPGASAPVAAIPPVVPVAAAVEPRPVPVSHAPHVVATTTTTSRPRATATATAKPAGKGSIVRDAPF